MESISEKDRAEGFVYRVLPELKELKAGCYLYSGISALLIVTDVDESNGDIYTRSTYNGFSTKYKKKEQGSFQIVGHAIQPHHWLKALRTHRHANWMLASVGDNFELIDMTDYGTKKFKNNYMIIGHANFYKRFCEALGI